MQILDLVPTVSRLYFLERLPTSISYGQAAILLCLGLQHHQLEHVEVSTYLFQFREFSNVSSYANDFHLYMFSQAQLKLPGSQILALFNKTIRRLHGQLHKAASKDIEAALPRLREVLEGHNRQIVTFCALSTKCLIL